MTTNSDREFYLSMDLNNVKIEKVQKITYAVMLRQVEETN